MWAADFCVIFFLGMPKQTVSELRRQCPFTTQPEYNPYKKSVLRQQLRRKYENNWHVGKSKQEKAALFSVERSALKKRFEDEYSNLKTLTQLAALEKLGADRIAGGGESKCSICLNNCAQAVLGCTHAFCLSCTIRVKSICPVCKARHVGTYTLVTDIGTV